MEQEEFSGIIRAVGYRALEDKDIQFGFTGQDVIKDFKHVIALLATEKRVPEHIDVQYLK